jgi:hypothetical protein
MGFRQHCQFQAKHLGRPAIKPLCDPYLLRPRIARDLPTWFHLANLALTASQSGH